jgi:hypothetical protein
MRYTGQAGTACSLRISHVQDATDLVPQGEPQLIPPRLASSDAANVSARSLYCLLEWLNLLGNFEPEGIGRLYDCM